MTSEIPAGSEEKVVAPTGRRFQRSHMSAAERRRRQEEVREVDFPIALRGYDRAAVDRYVEKVNQVIAELELSSSPESAVRHALEEVSEETSGLLQRAHETAEEITARSRARADERLQQADREAKDVREAAERDTHELRETAAREAQEVRATAQREVEEIRMEAETRVRELDRNAEAMRRERQRFIDDMRTVAQQQLEIADAAAARLPGEGNGVGADQPTAAPPGP